MQALVSIAVAPVYWDLKYIPLLTLAQYFLVDTSGFYFLSVNNSYFKDIVELRIQQNRSKGVYSRILRQ